MKKIYLLYSNELYLSASENTVLGAFTSPHMAAKAANAYLGDSLDLDDLFQLENIGTIESEGELLSIKEITLNELIDL